MRIQDSASSTFIDGHPEPDQNAGQQPVYHVFDNARGLGSVIIDRNGKSGFGVRSWVERLGPPERGISEIGLDSVGRHVKAERMKRMKVSVEVLGPIC
jgi:hypothetical protein